MSQILALPGIFISLFLIQRHVIEPLNALLGAMDSIWDLAPRHIDVKAATEKEGTVCKLIPCRVFPDKDLVLITME